jgi:hypothetical protein
MLIAAAPTLRIDGLGALGVNDGRAIWKALYCVSGARIRWLPARVGVVIGAVRIGMRPIAILLPDTSPKRSSLPLGHAVRHAFHDLRDDISKVAFDADFTNQQGVNEALVVIDIA